MAKFSDYDKHRDQEILRHCVLLFRFMQEELQVKGFFNLHKQTGNWHILCANFQFVRVSRRVRGELSLKFNKNEG